MRIVMETLSIRWTWAVCKEKTCQPYSCQRTTRFLFFVIWTLLGGVPAWAEPAQDTPFVETGRQGMVVTANVQASEAGLEMLRRGGNAVDAAVAASFCDQCDTPAVNRHWGVAGFCCCTWPTVGNVITAHLKKRSRFLLKTRKSWPLTFGNGRRLEPPATCLCGRAKPCRR